MKRRIHVCHMRRRIHVNEDLTYEEEDTCVSCEEEDTCKRRLDVYIYYIDIVYHNHHYWSY